jgi:membrane protein implicated in regulation of membrane protease activity
VIDVIFFLVVASAAAYLLAPVFRRIEVPSPDRDDALEAAQAAALRSLQDLELDWGTGKLSDEDYRAQRAAVEGELAAIVRKMSPPGP